MKKKNFNAKKKPERFPLQSKHVNKAADKKNDTTWGILTHVDPWDNLKLYILEISYVTILNCQVY